MNGARLPTTLEIIIRRFGRKHMSRQPPIEKVNLAEKFNLFEEHWSPKIAGEVNDSYVKLVKFTGEFVWHHHDRTDDLFICLSGQVRVQLRDGDVELGPGEMLIVPVGVEHCVYAEREAHLLVLEHLGDELAEPAEAEMSGPFMGL